MVVAPVEPIIFERGDAVEAFALRGAGGGAALEVPLADGGGVDQHPLFRVALEKEFCVAPINPADENAEGFAVGTEDQEQRRAVDSIENRRLLGEGFPGLSAGGAVAGEADDD